MKTLALVLLATWSTLSFSHENMSFKERIALGSLMEIGFAQMKQKYPSPKFMTQIESSMTSASDKKQFANLAKSWSKNYSEHISYANMGTSFIVSYYGAPFAKIEILNSSPYTIAINGMKIEIDSQNIFASFNQGMKEAGFTVPGMKIAHFQFILPEAEAEEAGTYTIYNSMFVGMMSSYYSHQGSSQPGVDFARRLTLTENILADKSWMNLPILSTFHSRDKVACTSDQMEGELHPAMGKYIHYVAKRNSGVVMDETLTVSAGDPENRNKTKTIDVMVRARVEKIKPDDWSYCTKHICEMLNASRHLGADCGATQGKACEGDHCEEFISQAVCQKMNGALLVLAPKYEMCLDHECSEKMDIPSNLPAHKLGEYYDNVQKYKKLENAFLVKHADVIKNNVIAKVEGKWAIVDPSGLDGAEATQLQMSVNEINATKIEYPGMVSEFNLQDHFNAAMGMLDCCGDTKCKISLNSRSKINLAPETNSSTTNK